MIATYTGRPPVPITNLRSYLYVCNREHNDLDFHVPVPNLGGVQVFVPLGKVKPVSYQILLYNLCDDTNTAIAPDKYIIGLDPDGNWYGVFTFPSGGSIPRFFSLAFFFTFPDSDVQHLWITQAYEWEIQCRPLTRIEACFPISRTDEFGYDVTGIYFGQSTDIPNTLGTPNLSYRHFAYLRRGKVFQEAPKLTFTSNARRNFRTKVERPYELRSDLVPDWWKEYLLAIFARGFIQVDDREVYRVTDSAFEGVNEWDRTWKPYVKLMREKDFQFGCDDCTTPVLPCLNTLVPGEWYTDEQTGNFIFPFVGSLPAQSIFEWQLYSGDGADFLVSGTLTQGPWQIVTDFGIDPAENCYQVLWRVKCANGDMTVFSYHTFGNCDTNTKVDSTFSIASYGNGNTTGGGQHCSAQGTTQFRLRFTQPLADDLHLQFAALYYPDNGSGSYQAIGGNIIPAGHPDKSIFNGWGQTSGNGYDAPLDITIPAGTTDYTTGMLGVPPNGVLISFPLCNPTWGNKASHRLYYKVVTQATDVNFNIAYDTASPFNTVPGGIVVLEQL